MGALIANTRPRSIGWPRITIRCAQEMLGLADLTSTEPKSITRVRSWRRLRSFIGARLIRLARMRLPLFFIVGNLFVAICLTQGCTSPSQRVDAAARRLQMEPVLVSGEGFQHRVYVDPRAGSGPVVHVYLEGDGLPWVTRHRVSPDPTPRNPLALHLAARDPTPSLLLGRPCYYGITHPDKCRPGLWTSERYSEEVLSSMLAALRRLLPEQSNRRIRLVGYSGGGVLAMLMAEHLADVDEVVTLAANLDIDAWADLHGYSRLAGSLNPVERTPLPARVRRTHLAGELDQEVPVGLIRKAAARDTAAVVHAVPGFDHRCCWKEYWRVILKRLEHEGTGASRWPRIRTAKTTVD